MWACIGECPAPLGARQGRGQRAGPPSCHGLVSRSAWDMLMHTCRASASSEAWRAGRLLGLCGTALSPEL